MVNCNSIAKMNITFNSKMTAISSPFLEDVLTSEKSCNHKIVNNLYVLLFFLDCTHLIMIDMTLKKKRTKCTICSTSFHWVIIQNSMNFVHFYY